ncbi:MAG TPA: hypothetical protein VE569_02680 [Acidimicrobiia bacterium]|jgi:5,10-methylenetetrahydrofolate reductase|nr:hypothetical protein [Acidimicrobiia bacterium]
MLTKADQWVRIAEVNPPALADMSHLLLDGAWRHVMITDNVFGKIRVSPYAYAARITHDVPSVHPTVVVSTRDRNILAIESEARGALGNGVDSFLVVNGDSLPQVDHLAHHYEITEHLRNLQQADGVPPFEVGMPTRLQEWHYRQRIDRGAQFLVAGPVIDPDTVEPNLERIRIRADDPPLFLMVSPPFSLKWIQRIESMGGVPATDQLKKRLASSGPPTQRQQAWSLVSEIELAAHRGGCAGMILTGLKYDTLIDEAAGRLRNHAPAVTT